VRGTVVDAGGVPVPGVVVQLLDSASAVRGRALSDELGRFLVATVVPGTYRVQTLRIGFRSVLSDAISLATGREVPQSFTLTGLPSKLDTVRVGGRNVCGRASESAAATAAVWEQVRTALLATQLSAANRRLMTTTVSYRRRLDEVGWRILDQYTQVQTEMVAQPWTAPNAESLQRIGYIAVGSDSTSYRAPGVEALASPLFIDDHCFRLTDGRDKATLGVAFEPIPDRKDVGDIRGTIYVDKATSELRGMEFRYIHRAVPDLADGARGTVDFTRLRNGTWTISKWEVRMPLREIRMLGGGRRVAYTSGAETKVVTTGFRVEGGELAVARIAFDTLFARPPLVLRGELRDSTTGRAVVGASVSLLGTSQATRSDARGEFRLNDVLPGDYTLLVSTPGLDSLGTPDQTSVSVTDAKESLRIRVMTSTQVVSRLCGAARERRAIPGIVLGAVAGADNGAPPTGTRVVLEWTDRGASAPRTARIPMDEAGNFTLCGVPTGTPLTLSAATDSTRSESMSLMLAPDKPLEAVRLLLDRAGPAASRMTGTVTGDSGRSVVPDAEVIFPDLARSTHSDSQGRFELRDIPAGTHKLLVRKPGYGPMQTSLSFVANETLDRRVVLSRVTVLNEVVVTAAYRRMDEFEARRKVGLGVFMTREFLETQEGRPMSAIFGNMPGAWITYGGLGNRAAALASSRKCLPVVLRFSEFSDSQNCSPCYALVWVDDHVMNIGGEPFDMNSLDARQIEGMEYYRGAAEVPARYLLRDKGACGVLVVHMRLERK
jgi:hypothetical protein